MANSLDVKVIEEGHRNAVVKLVGLVTDSDLLQNPAISLGLFSNTPPGQTLNGLKVVEAEFTVSTGLVVNLGWNATPEQPIAALQGAGEIDGDDYGGFSPDITANNYDGNINLSTKGFVPGQTYGFTIVLTMVKRFSA